VSQRQAPPPSDIASCIEDDILCRAADPEGVLLDLDVAQSDEPLRNETGRQLDDTPDLITCDPVQLRPHPAYREVCGDPSESKLLALSQYSGLWQEPLIVTADRTILDGHARHVIAIRQKRAAVTCIQYDLAEPEALRFILNRHREASGLTPYCRVLLGAA
jgi:hypothetical protein